MKSTMAADWITVTNLKKKRRDARISASKEERLKWAAILNDCAHIVLPHRARRLRERLNVDKLDEKLMSDDWIEYQNQGWIYSRVIKPKYHQTVPKNTLTVEYSVLEVDNGWKDTVLFYRQIKG